MGRDSGAAAGVEVHLRNLRFWWPRREFSPEAVAALLNRFVTAGAEAGATPTRWFFGGDTRAEALTHVAFDLQDPGVRVQAGDVAVGESEFDLAFSVGLWAPGDGELAGDWGVSLQIDRVENRLWPDDILEVTFSPRVDVDALVEVGVEVLQATGVDGIVFDPDWLEKIVPNQPGPEPQVATLYTR